MNTYEQDIEYREEWLISNISKLISKEDYLRATIVEEDCNIYDGDENECIMDTVNRGKRLEELSQISSIKMLDKKERDGVPINVLKLIGYMASIQEIREIVYNNTHGIVVRTPKRCNYPEQVVINTLKEIIVEGITTLSASDKEKALMYLDSSPQESIAGKINQLIPIVELEPKHGDTVPECSGVWEQNLSRLTNEKSYIEEIPEEDAVWWRSIYRTRVEYTYGYEFEMKGE